MICERCGGTGVETFDTTDARGYLSTGSLPCKRCERIKARRSWSWMILAFLALTLGLTPAILEVAR